MAGSKGFDRVADIARAVLYEGYLLYPYRPSALKNCRRWMFGGVFPHAYAASAGETCSIRAECLLRGAGETKLYARLRFLRLVREPAAPSQTAEECDVAIAESTLDELCRAPRDAAFDMAERGGTAKTLAGAMTLSARRLSDGVYRLTALAENRTDVSPAALTSRDAAQQFAFLSAHMAFRLEGGAFISLTDPPQDLREAAESCANRGLWPVLAGEPGETDLLLASPIILPDHPQVAPESPGDLFDCCEIDEILTLRILTMTDAEKREMAEADPRARALLERTEALGADDLERLHGALRDPRRAIAPVAPPLDDARLTVGARVRLRPRRRADIFDGLLDGMVAVVEGVERDFEDRVQLAVTLLDDPGRDFGAARYPGHRFFFEPDEVEPMREAP